MTTVQTTTVTFTDPAPAGYFTTRELRARWGCGRTKLYELIDSDGFPEGVRIGGQRLFPKHLVWEWETTEAA